MKDEKLQAQVNETREHIKEPSTWLRGLYIILFAILFNVAEIVIAAVVVFQFFHALLSGKPNKRLLTLGQSLSTYAYQLLAYLTFNSDHRPYPFGGWPRGAPSSGSRKSSVAKSKPSNDANDTSKDADDASDEAEPPIAAQ
jgi:hypothetical protein